MATHITEWVSGFMRRALRFVLPAHCAGCSRPLTDDPISHFCADCWSAIALMPEARCARCDRPFPSSIATTYSPHHVCRSCAERPPSYTKAWTLYPYRPPLRDAICLFKYQGKVSLAAPLAALMTGRLPPLDSIDVIMPVPLHMERLRQREFNQSLLLAHYIGRRLALPVAYTNLIRAAPTPAQTTLSRKSRLKNLRRAFVVRRPDAIAQQRILLIDDVFTTGTTVNECAKALRRAGSADVFAVTLCRTLDTDLIPDRILAQRPYYV
jgi:ComF family protein